VPRLAVDFGVSTDDAGKASTPKTESVARCDSVGLRTPNQVPVQGIMFRQDEAEIRHSLRHVALHISAGASGRSVGGETRAVETRTATAFSDTAPCKHVVAYRSFGGSYYLHHQGDRPSSKTVITS
jgi:hypothetical protein